ncbi:hypothetical protein [Dactylosporangium sp. CA-092794]|uniref:hypothetical protein n=1 Tax=Dactylosporangium sp. CA-092794 TaxID=3239929 RepID=UPI003D8B9B77
MPVPLRQSRRSRPGLAGARLRERFFAERWLIRIGSGRAVKLTPAGAAALRDLLGID